jgi:hypothetical protein
MWYAVYTEREVSGRLSEDSALATGPVLLTSVPRLTTQPGDGRVDLTWSVPKNAIRVEIQREEVATGDLIRFTSSPEEPPRIVDDDVRNGMPYRYTARAVYTYEVPGRSPVVRHSSDVVREVRPAPPPAAPGPLEVTGYPPLPNMNMYQQRVRLDWPPAEAGEVRVVRTLPGQPVPAPGTDFPEDELGKYAQVLLGHDFRWMPYHQPVCYFTPVLVLNGRCYPGEPRAYAVGPEVEEIRAEHVGTSVAVTWTWPDGVDEALVAWQQEKEVTDPLLAPQQTTVRRADCETHGECQIVVGSFRQIFVRVAAVVREGGAVFFTSGAGANAWHQIVTLVYEVQSGRGQRARIILRPDRAAYLPALILLGRTDGQPAVRGDKLLHRIPPRRFEPGAVIDVHLDKAIRPGSVRLFTEDDGDTRVLSIVRAC